MLGGKMIDKLKKIIDFAKKQPVLFFASLFFLYILVFGKKRKMIPLVDPHKLPFLEKVKTNQVEFANKVIDIAKKLHTDPRYLMIVMNNESGLNHLAKNPTSSATGLLQFMHDTAIGLGTTTDKLLQMTNVQQLDYVYKYLSKYSNKFTDDGGVSDIYLSVYFPKALYHPEDYVFPQWATKANKNFDLNKDGIGTKREFRAYVNTKYKDYLK